MPRARYGASRCSPRTSNRARLSQWTRRVWPIFDTAVWIGPDYQALTACAGGLSTTGGRVRRRYRRPGDRRTLTSRLTGADVLIVEFDKIPFSFISSMRRIVNVLIRAQKSRPEEQSCCDVSSGKSFLARGLVPIPLCLVNSSEDLIAREATRRVSMTGGMAQPTKFPQPSWQCAQVPFVSLRIKKVFVKSRDLR
jgi:hypothetical protein